MSDDPICVCGTELSGHSGWDNHGFMSAEDYYRSTTNQRPTKELDMHAPRDDDQPERDDARGVA